MILAPLAFLALAFVAIGVPAAIAGGLAYALYGIVTRAVRRRR